MTPGDQAARTDKLYGDYVAEDWLRALDLAFDEIPDVLIVHGEWEPDQVLARWSARLGS